MFERIYDRQTFFGKLWYIYGQRLHRWMIAKNTNVYLKPMISSAIGRPCSACTSRISRR